VEFQADLGGLTANTTYYFEACALSSGGGGGLVTGSVASFITNLLTPPSPLYVASYAGDHILNVAPGGTTSTTYR
jgi:hypothetical protein